MDQKQNQFDTFEDLELYLKSHTDLCMTRRYLQDRLADEISFLVTDSNKKHPTMKWESSTKKDILVEINKAAREDYLEDINYFLLNNVQLSHMSIMGYRRKQHAWAIADAIKEYQTGE